MSEAPGPAVEAALAALRDERRRRLGGALDAVAVTRANASTSSAAITAAAGTASAALPPIDPEPATRPDRGGWGPRHQAERDGVLRPVDHADRPVDVRPAPDDGSPDPDDPGDSWLR